MRHSKVTEVRIITALSPPGIERILAASGREFPAVAAAVVLACALLAAGCGHVVSASFAPNHGVRFDFKKPPCRPAPKDAFGDDEVAMRYLGAGGLYIRWRGASLMTGPFFSNPGFWKVMFGKLAPDAGAVESGLAGIDAAGVQAILVGHSHYDHIGDLQIVAMNFATKARLYVNQSGGKMLAAYETLAERTVDLSAATGSWIQPQDDNGLPLPFRFMPIASGHAPQIGRLDWADGEVEEPWNAPWDQMPIRRFLAGTTYGFVIDLMSDEPREVRFRIYYQDAANAAGVGKPPHFEEPDAHPYDLAVMCMASSHLAEDHPGWLLAALEPRHVLITHYENFMRPRGKPLVFAPLLTGKRADAFLERLRAGLEENGVEARGPARPSCGPADRGYTMPLPGEWLSFRVEEGVVPPRAGPTKEE